jgi:hypothetical protein
MKIVLGYGDAKDIFKIFSPLLLDHHNAKTKTYNIWDSPVVTYDLMLV